MVCMRNYIQSSYFYLPKSHSKHVSKMRRGLVSFLKLLLERVINVNRQKSFGLMALLYNGKDGYHRAADHQYNGCRCGRPLFFDYLFFKPKLKSTTSTHLQWYQSCSWVGTMHSRQHLIAYHHLHYLMNLLIIDASRPMDRYLPNVLPLTLDLHRSAIKFRSVMRRKYMEAYN